MGWSRFFTIYSREQNVDGNGNPLIYLNDSDLNNLSSNLTGLVGESMTNFIILARQYGATSSAGGSNAQDPGGAELNLSQQGSQKISSLLSLVNATVSAPSPDGSKSVSYASPLNDTGTLQELFPILWNSTTLQSGTDMPARININTAPVEVLQALESIKSSPLSETDVQAIISSRPTLSSGQGFTGDFASPVWLVTQAGLTPSKLSQIEKYITTRTQVYRVHVQGKLDSPGGLSARVEAVIDTNGGQPRILSWRNLGELGKAASASQLSQAGVQQ
jgi:hypothetical protein